MRSEPVVAESYLWKSATSTKTDISGDILLQYRNLINSKREFNSNFGAAYLDQGYTLKLQGFTRDLLLEAYECEDATYERPTLTRECFTLKHIMHASEKIVVKKNLNSFPYNQPMHKLKEMVSTIIGNLNSKVTIELQTCILGLVQSD